MSKTSEIVKASSISNFIYFRNKEFHYETDSGFHFRVPLEDVQDGVSIGKTEKTLHMMRWIRKEKREWRIIWAIDILGEPDYSCPKIDIIQAELNDIEDNVATLKVLISDCYNSIKICRDTFEAVRKTNDTLRSDNRALDKKAEEAEEQQGRLEEELEEALETINDLKNEIEELGKEADSLT